VGGPALEYNESKMADGRHIENFVICSNSVPVQPIERKSCKSMQIAIANCEESENLHILKQMEDGHHIGNAKFAKSLQQFNRT